MNISPLRPCRCWDHFRSVTRSGSFASEKCFGRAQNPLSKSRMAEPTSLSGENLWGKIPGWLAAHPYFALTLAVFTALGPFLAKPFNIDDPLFIWLAHQIQVHPGDPYGFSVNW